MQKNIHRADDASCAQDENPSCETVSVDINHESFFDNTIHRVQVFTPNEITNCWECSAPLIEEGYFFGFKELLSHCKEHAASLLEKMKNTIHLPDCVWPIPTGANDFRGKACSFGCALSVIQKEHRHPNAHAKLLNMLSSINYKHCKPELNRSSSNERQLMKWFGGPKNTSFCQTKNKQFQVVSNNFALYDSRVKESQKFTVKVTEGAYSSRYCSDENIQNQKSQPNDVPNDLPFEKPLFEEQLQEQLQEQKPQEKRTKLSKEHIDHKE